MKKIVFLAKELVIFEEMDEHLANLCTKRPAQPLECRLGCGRLFGGTFEMLIQAETDRLEHGISKYEIQFKI